MNRTLGRTIGHAARGFACLLAGSLALAQQPAQNWQSAQNYPPANGQNYQPPAQSGNTQTGNSAAAGQYPYQQQPQGSPQQYPTLERRQSDTAGQTQYAPANAADNRQSYPQYPTQGQPPQDQSAQGQYSQGQPSQSPPPQGQAQGPIQGPPIQGPPIQGAPMRPVAPQVPFVLSPPEIRALENLLTDWERRNKDIHVMESDFFRWRYDAVFSTPNQPPPPPDEGKLKFASPDKAWMKVTSKDPKRPDQSEQWLCDGKSVFQWDYTAKVVHEWIMPPELQGKGIGDGPLPFVFGIEAQKLKRRYFMRIITPPNVPNEVWLEAFPKYQQDAANYSKVEVILKLVGTTQTLFPYAIQIYAPNGKDRIVYQLQNPSINPHGGWLTIGRDWTKPAIDFGWTKKTELPPNSAPNSTPQSGMNGQTMRR